MKTAGSGPPSDGARDLADERVDLPAVGVALDGHVDEPEALLRAGCDTSRASTIAPAQVPRIGRPLAANARKASSHGSASKNFQSVVDSPPGMIRPAGAREVPGRRASKLSTPISASALRCASKSPCSARTATARPGFASPSARLELRLFGKARRLDALHARAERFLGREQRRRRPASASSP